MQKQRKNDKKNNKNDKRKVVMILKENDLLKIQGGAKYTFLLAIGAIGVFIAGVIDGIFRPFKCN